MRQAFRRLLQGLQGYVRDGGSQKQHRMCRNKLASCICKCMLRGGHGGGPCDARGVRRLVPILFCSILKTDLDPTPPISRECGETRTTRSFVCVTVLCVCVCARCQQRVPNSDLRLSRSFG